ncbi:MAG TPA: hypothetical protein VGM16_08515 [Gammaproteobacteria bacterium]|jgi:hypothetical protein
MTQEQDNRKKNRLTLLLLLAVFLVPALGSWLLYAYRDQVHLGTTNKGEFVQPARKLDPVGLSLPVTYFAHHQTLIYVAGPDCGNPCRDALRVMQATQQALGEKSALVQRLYLSPRAPRPDLVAADPALTARGPVPNDTLKPFAQEDAPKYIYLADPNGYVVMRWSLAQDPKFILIDLRHLLGASEG